MNSTSVFIHAISVIAPGLKTWEDCSQIFRGNAIYEDTEIPKLVPELLPKNERRRTTQTIKLALCTAANAIESAGIEANETCSVFASSNGDLDIVDRVCNDLLLPDHPISPTQFHNSVHNAPAGYWAIATHSRRPSNSISAGPFSFASGLMEAITMAEAEQETVLLVAYDYPTVEPLTTLATTFIPFGCALLISANTSLNTSFSSKRKPLAKLQLKGYSLNECEPLKNSKLEALCTQNPIAQSLRLLEPLAMLDETEQCEIRLPSSENNYLSIHVSK